MPCKEKYSESHLIGLWFSMLSNVFCNWISDYIDLICSMLFNKITSYCYHSDNIISFPRSQSGPIKQVPLSIQISKTESTNLVFVPILRSAFERVTSEEEPAGRNVVDEGRDSAEQRRPQRLRRVSVVAF